MSGNPGAGTSPPFFQSGAIAIREHLDRNRRLFLITGAVVVSAAIVLSIAVNLLSHAGSPKAPAVAAAPAPDIVDPLAIMRPSDGTNGTALVLAGGAPLFPLPGSGQLTYKQDAPVEGQGVRVQQIAGDEGFWIGDNDAQRVFVHVAPEAVAGGAIAPNTLQQGQLINLSGRMEPLPGDLGSLGVADLEFDQLNTQSELIEANSVRLPAP